MAPRRTRRQADDPPTEARTAQRSGQRHQPAREYININADDASDEDSPPVSPPLSLPLSPPLSLPLSPDSNNTAATSSNPGGSSMHPETTGGSQGSNQCTAHDINHFF